MDPATDREQSSRVLKFEFAPVQISGEHYKNILSNLSREERGPEDTLWQQDNPA
jgi:hypothetical protein